MLHHIKAVGQRRGKAKILLHQHDGVASGLEGANHVGELLHNHRCQTFRDFVEQQKPRAGAQDTRHCQHLLLTARQPGARAGGTLLQIREHGVNLRQRHAAGRNGGWQHQVFFGTERGKNPALFRAIADTYAQPGNLVRRQMNRFLAADFDRAFACAGQAHQRAQRGGAARAVAAQQRDHFAFMHAQVHAVQDMRLAIPGMQIFNF